MGARYLRIYLCTSICISTCTSIYVHRDAYLYAHLHAHLSDLLEKALNGSQVLGQGGLKALLQHRRARLRGIERHSQLLGHGAVRPSRIRKGFRREPRFRMSSNRPCVTHLANALARLTPACAPPPALPGDALCRGIWGPFLPPTPGGSPARRGAVAAPTPPPKTLFFSKTAKAGPPRLLSRREK